MLATYRMVTLLELLEHNAEAFCRLSSIIGQSLVLLDVGRLEDFKQLAGSFGELQRESERLGLPATTKQLKRIYQAFTTKGTDLRAIRPMVLDLYNRLRDELEERCFVAISAEMTDVYTQTNSPFGDHVFDAFPTAIEDISEAGKCLSLGRATASVFHLMRAMEVAVAALSTSLRVTNTEKEWGKLLSNISSAIETMPKGKSRDEWSEARTHLYHVKQAWRNSTMHPKQTYTFEEARAIYSAVCVFMGDLASLISQQRDS